MYPTLEPISSPQPNGLTPAQLLGGAPSSAPRAPYPYAAYKYPAPIYPTYPPPHSHSQPPRVAPSPQPPRPAPSPQHHPSPPPSHAPFPSPAPAAHAPFPLPPAAGARFSPAFAAPHSPPVLAQPPRPVTSHHVPELHDCVRQNNYHALLGALRAGHSPNQPDQLGEYPIHVACNSESLDPLPLVKALLLYGANPNARDPWGWTPLHAAASQGRVPICQLLLSLHSIEVDLQNSEGCTPLMYISRGMTASSSPAEIAAGLSLIAALVARGASIHARNQIHETPLLMSSLVGATAAAEFLLRSGADPNAQNIFADCALHYAVRTENTQLVQLLLAHGARVDLVSHRTHRTPPQEALHQKSLALCQLFLPASLNNATAIHTPAHPPPAPSTARPFPPISTPPQLSTSPPKLSGPPSPSPSPSPSADPALPNDQKLKLLPAAPFKITTQPPPSARKNTAPAPDSPTRLSPDLSPVQSPSHRPRSHSGGEMDALLNAGKPAPPRPPRRSPGAPKGRRLLSPAPQENRLAMSLGGAITLNDDAHAGASVAVPYAVYITRAPSEEALPKPNSSSTSSSSSSSSTSSTYSSSSVGPSTKESTNQSRVSPSRAALAQSAPSTFETHGHFADHFTMGRQLGQGAFATVYECHEKSSGTAWAVKVVSKRILSADSLRSLDLELAILKRISHPNVISLKNIYQEDEDIYIVTDLVCGGELFDRIKQLSKYTENDARVLLRNICGAIEYLHKNGIVHRDLKPENLLMANTSDHTSVKIADFGLARYFDEAAVMRTTCGTPAYIAPEMLEGTSYGASVDMWAIGIIAYILLTGTPPFAMTPIARLMYQIMNVDVPFPDEKWACVSPEAKDFVAQLLVKEPEKRLTATQSLKHPWLSGTTLASSENTLAIADRIQRFQFARHSLFGKSCAQLPIPPEFKQKH